MEEVREEIEPHLQHDDTDPILRAAPMPITTERLILRPPEIGDGQALYEAVDETWDQLNEWMLWASERESISAEFYETYARDNAAQFMRRENIAILVFERASGQLVASSGLHRIDWALGRFEIGYWVREAAQGQGYAQEIADALTRYAFQALGANTVLICHAEGNERSRSVIERLGYTHCGCVPNGIRVPSGALLGEHMYYRTDIDGLAERDVSWPAP